jgi:hypothetical protein
MKTSKIFVGVNGATLAFQSGVNAVAVYPVQKGGKKSYALTDTGKLINFTGSRINGVGIARFLKENGFDLAQPGDTAAAKLADFLDVIDGTDLVSTAMSTRSGELQKQFSGKTCTFVPFDPDQAIRQVEVEADRSYITHMFDLESGFDAAMVKTVYQPGSGYVDVSLSKGWLVGPDADASSLPRMNEVKELIEYAVYAICASGLGTLVGAQNLVTNETSLAFGLFYKGPLEIALMNGDRLLVGGTADDLLAVKYLRNNVVLYSRIDSFSAPKLGPVIGDIAAVLVRVAELDAQPVKKALKKAA